MRRSGAPVAQLAEQRTLNPKVPGSIPGGGTDEGLQSQAFRVSGCATAGFRGTEKVPKRGRVFGASSLGRPCHRSQDTSSASRASAGPRGEPSTGSRTGARSSARSGPRGPGRGRPPAGYFTKRTAEAWLADVLGHGARRDAAGHGPDRRDVRRRLRRVPALRRVRPRPQAVDGGRLPLDHPGAPAARVRLAAPRGPDRPIGSRRGRRR